MRDETACGHRCAEELRCQARNTVEIGIGRRIEDSGAIKSGEAHLLRQGSGHKFKGWPRRQAGIWNRPTERGQSSGIITQTDRHIGFAGLSVDGQDAQAHLLHLFQFVHVLPRARTHRLSVYDAAYLELAQREGLPLATLDADLRKAAAGEGVAPVCRDAKAPEKQEMASDEHG